MLATDPRMAFPPHLGASVVTTQAPTKPGPITFFAGPRPLTRSSAGAGDQKKGLFSQPRVQIDDP
jgi:hypothetical protein